MMIMLLIIFAWILSKVIYSLLKVYKITLWRVQTPKTTLRIILETTPLNTCFFVAIFVTFISFTATLSWYENKTLATGSCYLKDLNLEKQVNLWQIIIRIIAVKLNKSIKPRAYCTNHSLILILFYIFWIRSIVANDFFYPNSCEYAE